jgi:arsenate reductase-like glutaredoxin family protein
MAPAELRRFAQRFGATALVDQSSRAYTETGMAYLRLDAEELLERLQADQRLLRLPLVRAGDRLSVGFVEGDWRAWLK